MVRAISVHLLSLAFTIPSNEAGQHLPENDLHPRKAGGELILRLVGEKVN